MKKFAKVILAVAVLAVGGSIAAWYMGRGEVETRIDIELAKLANDGIEVTQGAREITGFPDSYIVTLRDVVMAMPARKVAVNLPSLRAEASALDPETLIFTLPEKFDIQVELPPAPAPNVETEGGGADEGTEEAAEVPSPETFEMEIEAEDLTIAISGQPGSGQKIDVASPSIVLVHSSDEGARSMAIELQGLASNTTLPAGPSGGETNSTGRLDGIDMAIIIRPEGAPSRTFESQISDLTMTARSDARRYDDYLALAAGKSDGMLDASYSFGETTSVLRVEGGGPATDGTLRFSSKLGASTMKIEKNQAVFSMLVQTSKIDMLPADQDYPIQGGIGITDFDLFYDLPIGPGEEMVPGAFKLGLVGITPDEALWSRLDKEGVLARDPIHFFVNLDATLRLTRNPNEITASLDPPLEFGNVSVNEVLLEAFGASAEARGELEFVPPILTPRGNLQLEFNSVLEAIRSLQEAGLLATALADYVELLSQAFTRPGETPEQLTSEVKFTNNGILVNGIPVD